MKHKKGTYEEPNSFDDQLDTPNEVEDSSDEEVKSTDEEEDTSDEDYELELKKKRNSKALSLSQSALFPYLTLLLFSIIPRTSTLSRGSVPG
nr:hypothetical protein [Tanacetum cinerariifolium]